jgi:hypothetical protein
VSRDTARLEMAGLTEADDVQRDLSLLDWSRVADVSADGRLVLFDESGVAGGPGYSVYLRRLDDNSAAQFVGDGLGMGLSPDGTHALTLGFRDRTHFRLLPLGGGEPIDLRPTGLEYQWARFFPDGHRLLALANEPNQPLRLYVQPLEGKPFQITPPTVVRNVAISPDGTNVALMSADRQLLIYPVAGGEARLVPTAEPLAPVLWTEGDWLFVQHVGAYTQVPTSLPLASAHRAAAALARAAAARCGRCQCDHEGDAVPGCPDADLQLPTRAIGAVHRRAGIALAHIRSPISSMS